MRALKLAVELNSTEMIVTHIHCTENPEDVAVTLLTEYAEFDDAVKLASLPHMYGNLQSFDTMVEGVNELASKSETMWKDALAEGKVSELAYPLKRAQIESASKAKVIRPENLLFSLYNGACAAVLVFREGDWFYHWSVPGETYNTAVLERCMDVDEIRRAVKRRQRSNRV